MSRSKLVWTSSTWMFSCFNLSFDCNPTLKLCMAREFTLQFWIFLSHAPTAYLSDSIIFKPTYHPLILAKKGYCWKSQLLNLLSLLLLLLLLFATANLSLSTPTQLLYNLYIYTRFFADTDQGSMILDGRKIWTSRVTTEKKQMWTFPLGKKTQLFIQKTERFANIEFGLISFQFNARKPKAPDER